VAEVSGGDESPVKAVEAIPGKCPWQDAAEGLVRRPDMDKAARDGLYLNEVGVLQALEAQRKRD